MFKVLVALIFIGVGGTIGWYAITNENFCLLCEKQSDSSSHSTNSLQMTLIQDLALAAKDKDLPASWDQISEVRYVYHSKKIQQVLSNSPIVAINKKGTKRLIVEFFDEPGSPDIVMVRYNMIDVASENTVGEMNRRLKLPPMPAVPEGNRKPVQKK